MINTDEIKCSWYPNFPTTDTIKNDQLRKELESIPYIIKYIRDKKIEDFVKIFRIATDHTYEIDDPLLVRHFLFKAVEEVNDDLLKNNKSCRVDFGDEAGTHFINETKAYWEKSGFYNDDGTLNHFKLGRPMETFDIIIRGYTDHNKFIFYQKELKTDLVVLFL